MSKLINRLEFVGPRVCITLRVLRQHGFVTSKTRPFFGRCTIIKILSSRKMIITGIPYRGGGDIREKGSSVTEFGAHPRYWLPGYDVTSRSSYGCILELSLRPEDPT